MLVPWDNSQISENISQNEKIIWEWVLKITKIYWKKWKDIETSKLNSNINSAYIELYWYYLDILENDTLRKLFDNWINICDLEYIPNIKEKNALLKYITPFLLTKIIAKAFVEIFLEKIPLTKENYLQKVKQNFEFFWIIKFANNQDYINRSWELLNILLDYKTSDKCLYLHNIGRNFTNYIFDKLVPTSNHEKLHQQRKENKEWKYEKLLKNFCSKKWIHKEKFYQSWESEYIYPMLFWQDISKLFKITNESVGYNDEVVHWWMHIKSLNLPKLLSHHSYITKTFQELFFNPFLFGADHEKWWYEGLNNLKILLENAQEKIKKTSSLQSYSDIVSYLQLRNYSWQEKRCLVIILPQKYLEMDQNKLLWFQILPEAQAPKFDILENQIDDYDFLINWLVINENQTILPCNNLCLVYDAENLSLITGYPISEIQKNNIKNFINKNQLDFLLS